MYKHGLAYKATMPVNWCTSCKCVLANEEVVDGVCERCGSEVVRKEKSQWMRRELQNMPSAPYRRSDDVDYIERVKRSSSATDRPLHRRGGNVQDQYRRRGLFVIHHPCRYPVRCTYMVISPEHPMLNEWKRTRSKKNWDEVEAYRRRKARRKSDFERNELNKDKTGVPP